MPFDEPSDQGNCRLLALWIENDVLELTPVHLARVVALGTSTLDREGTATTLKILKNLSFTRSTSDNDFFLQLSCKLSL